MSPPRRTSWAAVVPVLAALAVSACGAPEHGDPVTITHVPYDLTRPAGATPTTPDPPGSARPYVFLLRGEVVVPVRARVERSATPTTAVTEVLAQLENGPSERERNSGLSTALAPGTTVRLSTLTDGVATIDLRAGDQAPAASRVPTAVAQLVLSVTSVPGVEAVLVTRDGERVELPLPGGALTASPVTASDYAELTRSTTPTATPRGAASTGASS